MNRMYRWRQALNRATGRRKSKFGFDPGLPGDPSVSLVQKVFSKRKGHYKMGNARFR